MTYCPPLAAAPQKDSLSIALAPFSLSQRWPPDQVLWAANTFISSPHYHLIPCTACPTKKGKNLHVPIFFGFCIFFARKGKCTSLAKYSNVQMGQKYSLLLNGPFWPPPQKKNNNDNNKHTGAHSTTTSISPSTLNLQSQSSPNPT